MEINTLRWLTLDNLDGEVWKDIPGYEGYYEVSSYGRVKSKERNVGGYYCRERILTQKLTQNYLYVGFKKDGKSKTLRVHRLVAKAFIPNPSNLTEVNHKDENTLNNRIENLEWCTTSYNLQYGTRIERGQKTRKNKKNKEGKIKLISRPQDDIATSQKFIDNLDGEEWRPVCGYEGLYEISNYGRLKSLYHKIPFIVRVQKSANGRVVANLHRNGKFATSLIHSLVARAFIPNPSNLTEVNHKDENPSNNHVDNLEWCTHRYNMHYGSLYQRISEKLKNNPEKSRPVAQYTLEGRFLKSWPSIREVKRTLNVRGWKSICSACKGNLHSALGYQWRYIERGKVIAEDIGPCIRRCSTAPKTIYQYTIDGIFVRSYPSVTEAGRSVHIASTNISACIKGKQRSAAGYLWFDKKL